MEKKSPNGGFALPAVIFALVVLGVLSTSGFFLARQETRIGVASERAQTAFYQAERGMNEVMSEWDGATFGALASWATATKTSESEDGFWSVDVTRMADRLFFLSSTGGTKDGSEVIGQAGRALGVVARLYSAELDAPAAFSARDRVRFVGKATVNGGDQAPPGWDPVCDGPLLTDKAGMLTDNFEHLSYKEANFDVAGNPPILEDPKLIEETFEIFEEERWNALAEMATHTMSPRNFNSIWPTTSASGECDTSNLQNWGDPIDVLGACAGYFPMIHIEGGGTSYINGGGIGQGIILVDGNLWAGGDFEFFGMILVKGKFETGGSGPRVHGAVMAGNADLEEQDLSGGSLVQYSSCALERAVKMNPDLNWVRPIERRGWVNISSVVGG